jgi:hypothetical protein
MHVIIVAARFIAPIEISSFAENSAIARVAKKKHLFH